MDKFDKFRAQLVIFYERHVLKFLLIVDWSDKDKAISIFEETHQLLSHTIFSNRHIRCPLLQFQSVLKILVR